MNKSDKILTVRCQYCGIEVRPPLNKIMSKGEIIFDLINDGGWKLQIIEGFSKNKILVCSECAI